MIETLHPELWRGKYWILDVSIPFNALGIDTSYIIYKIKWSDFEANTPNMDETDMNGDSEMRWPKARSGRPTLLSIS